MHEELIMKSESNRTWDNGEMYIISPNNSQWDSSGIPKAIKVDLSSYDSSGATFFTKNELRSLVKDFDKNYVYYCRGTGTSSHSIENAAIENARAVIVLADTTDIKNTKGLMAVLVARDNARKNISKRKKIE
mgnify:CR=1 FL=1